MTAPPLPASTEEASAGPSPSGGPHAVLPVGALIGGRHYRVIEVLDESGAPNRYLVQGQRPVLLCSNPECQGESPDGSQYCDRCGVPLTDVAAYSPRYLAKETIDIDPIQSEWTIAELGLAHPNVIPPQETFKEVINGTTRYFLVLDEPIWQTAAQVQDSHELPSVLAWGIGLADGLAYLHENHIVLREMDERQVAVWARTAKWADLSTTHVVPPEDWRQTGTQQIADDVRQLALLIYGLATGLIQYDPSVRLAMPKAHALFAQALGEFGYPTAGELAVALRDVESSIRHPGGIDVHAVRLSDVGQQRDLDEDSILTLELGQFHRSASAPLGIYLVADGMGGHEGGDVASWLTVRTIARRAVSDVLMPTLTDSSSPVEYEAWLKSVVQEANQVVFQRRKASGNDMGTTLVMAVVTGDGHSEALAHIAHVGDSRAYLISNGSIEQLTTDHSLVERLVATGQIRPEEAATHPRRSVIYRSIGDKSRVEPDVTTRTLSSGDVLMLCCDGLSGEISDEGILEIILDAHSLSEANLGLVNAANEAGGSDNISVVLIGVQAVE